MCIDHPGADGVHRTESVIENFLHLLVKSLSHPRLRLLDAVGDFLPTSPTASIPDVPPFRKAWNGSLTYRELGELTDRLARALMHLGIGPERFVPIYMERSQWTTVAILTMIKSGGAFSLLSPAHPLPRLQQICDDLRSSFILSSEAQAARCLKLGGEVLVIESLDQACRSSRVLQEMPPAQPGNALYVAFTSGSTGKPKGVVIEHQAYCSCAQSHIQAFQINDRSRLLQFAAYAFDVSILETLSTLMAGACLCVPSEAQRNDVVLFEDALRAFRLTHVGLPPSFTRIVPWANLEERPTLLLGGEPMRKSDRTIYIALGMRFMNAYGPTECSVNATIHDRVRSTHSVQNIGKPTGAVAWIVDLDDMEKPMQWNEVGELLLEGPIVGRGYLNNSDATRKAFIDPPAWLRRLRKGQYQYRVYRTGDLASQDQTGTIYIRVEVADVEHHVNDVVAISTEVVVEKLNTSDDHQMLIAFIVLDGPLPAQMTDSLFLTPEASDLETFKSIQEQLHNRLPRYMVPDLWIPLAYLPKAASSKIGRRLLRDTTAAMSQRDLYAFAGSLTEKRAPTTSSERTLQQVYADILQIPPATIGMDDTFLRLGGDSVQAIRLVGAARKSGLTVQMQEVLAEVSVADQADKAMTIVFSPEAVGAGSRVLHFSSYAFDVSIYEIFTTLAAGATLCIPSEFERKNALAETLQPLEVPCLSTLVVGGEAVSRENIYVWAPGRTLVNGYGPAEATICGAGIIPPTGWKPGLIGSTVSGVGGVGWVTMPTDTSRLAAIGAIGELLLEGPCLAAGYFDSRIPRPLHL
ncbi:hypothetical protein BDV38DRAFT_281099 [Aspergillus pseudotamarii]|uniref:Carrier domain-containing protein n=1 Tax=Aspergillus pseudotamarii TaxID=132259 RepID=A0A5N6SXJ2_ASPPS|nr:uncharacterized protein BDV38DRAFT_281099 [Aspergillus pseudotamarii]KAE8139332.1 hypothetical protein BDV38DRAFT_281099 [Aspergillus pseudotamarii]